MASVRVRRTFSTVEGNFLKQGEYVALLPLVKDTRKGPQPHLSLGAPGGASQSGE